MGRIKEAIMEHHSKCPLCGSEDVQEDAYCECMYCNHCNKYYDLLTGKEDKYNTPQEKKQDKERNTQLEKLKEEQEEEDEPEYWWQKY